MMVKQLIQPFQLDFNNYYPKKKRTVLEGPVISYSYMESYVQIIFVSDRWVVESLMKGVYHLYTFSSFEYAMVFLENEIRKNRVKVLF